MSPWIIGTLVLSVISPIFYTKSMLAQKARPHRVTRLIVWLASVAGILGVLHGSNLSAQIFAGIFFVRATYLLVMSLIFGVGGRSRIDTTCLIIGTAALVAYAITGSGLLAVSLGILADVVGYVPTFVKTFRIPTSEDPTFFAIETVAALFAVFAIGSIQTGILFPIYFVLCSLAVLGLIYRGRLGLSQSTR